MKYSGFGLDEMHSLVGAHGHAPLQSVTDSIENCYGSQQKTLNITSLIHSLSNGASRHYRTAQS
jgi:hypothetical protein